jgi:hypothetical protein
MTLEPQTQKSAAKSAPKSKFAEYQAKWDERIKYTMQTLCPAPEGTFAVYEMDDGTAYVTRVYLLAICQAQTLRTPKDREVWRAEWLPAREPFQAIEEVQHTEAGFGLCVDDSNYVGSIHLPNATVKTLRAAVLEEKGLKWDETKVPVK